MAVLIDTVLGLGSNIGDRQSQLQAAVNTLGGGDAPILSNIQSSRVYESPALLPAGTVEAGWDQPFYNMAVRGFTALEPEALLKRIKQIESTLGRQKRQHWAPREIDIDILTYGDGVYVSEALTIPHPALLERDFALLPLADVAPAWRVPADGEWQGQEAAAVCVQKGYHLPVAPMEVVADA